jgi:hypothetical protein
LCYISAVILDPPEENGFATASNCTAPEATARSVTALHLFGCSKRLHGMLSGGSKATRPDGLLNTNDRKTNILVLDVECDRRSGQDFGRLNGQRNVGMISKSR